MKKLVFTLLVATTALIGCGKDNGGGGAAPYGQNCYGNNYGNTMASTQFQWRNGQCIDNRTNNTVNPQMCPPPGGSPAVNPAYGNNPYGNQPYGAYGNQGCVPGGYPPPGYPGGYPPPGYPQYPGNGYPQYPGNGYPQYPGTGGSGSSPECQYLDKPGYYYKYEYFPGANTYMCVEYSIGTQMNYPY
ncbi:MAG: hypothetical protein KDD38_01985, partial [Bdellovibrionales bacterium]|nr:hypothetical protein [Bdellovibrionales bacterium]